jgi:hypothetical protein
MNGSQDAFRIARRRLAFQALFHPSDLAWQQSLILSENLVHSSARRDCARTCVGVCELL